MKLKEIFDQLTFGELSQISIGGGSAGQIRPQDYGKVVAHVNLGLTALYKRFALKEGRVLLELQPGQTLYKLNSQFAVTGKSRQTVRYLKDTVAEPFKDDAFKVERIYTTAGFELKLNDNDDEYSITTPSTLVLRVPEPMVTPTINTPAEYVTSGLRIVYRANHPKLVVDEDGEIDIETTEVELPDSHLEPLLLFIASRVLTPTGITGEFNSGNNYQQKYELACQELENNNLRIDQNSQPDRLHARGFV